MRRTAIGHRIPIGGAADELALALDWCARFGEVLAEANGTVGRNTATGPGDATADAGHGDRWSVLQHAEHLARSHAEVVDVIRRLAAADAPEDAPSEGRLRLSWLEELAFPIVEWTPASLEPSPAPDPAAVAEAWTAAVAGLGRLEDDVPRIAGASATAAHPFFGPLTPLLWIRFVAVHTFHHLELARRPT